MTLAVRKPLRYMAREGLSRAELARRLGVNRSCLTRWLSGEPHPQNEIRRAVSELAGIRDDWTRDCEPDAGIRADLEAVARAGELFGRW